MYNDELYHSGVMGMHWGQRRYQNEDGSYKPGAEGRYYTPVSKRQQKKNFKRLKKYENDPDGEKYQKEAFNQVSRTINADQIKRINKALEDYDKWTDVKSVEWEDSKEYYQMRDDAEKMFIKNNPEEYSRLKKEAKEGGFPVESHKYYEDAIDYTMEDPKFEAVEKKYKKQWKNSEGGKASYMADKAWNNYVKECESVSRNILGKYGDTSIKDHYATHTDQVKWVVSDYISKLGDQKISNVSK